MQLSREDLLASYRTMRTIREFEERVHKEFAEGGIPGFVHLYAGEEASAAGICFHLDDRDRIASNHRGHGHCLAKGCEPVAMMKEIYGRASGTCGGKGGSMHIADLAKGMMGANGIVGGGPPLACGAGLAAKTLNTGGVAVAFVGDGASNQGTTFESFNLAKVWNLPVIFVVEDNGYAESTASGWSVAGSQVKRAEGFGMRAYQADGFDFFDVHQVAGEAVAHAREGRGPSLIHVRLERFFGHFEGDAMAYRPVGEIDALRRDRDSLGLFRAKVSGAGLIEPAQFDAIDADVTALIDRAVDESKAAPFPAVADLLTDVYASY